MQNLCFQRIRAVRKLLALGLLTTSSGFWSREPGVAVEFPELATVLVDALIPVWKIRGLFCVLGAELFALLFEAVVRVRNSGGLDRMQGP